MMESGAPFVTSGGMHKTQLWSADSWDIPVQVNNTIN